MEMRMADQKCLKHYEQHWYRCVRDDSAGDVPGRTSYKVLACVFACFLLFGLFTAVQLTRSANVKHWSLYIFYFLALLTLARKSMISQIYLSEVRTTLFLDSMGDPYLYPDYVYLFLISFPTYTYLLCGLFY